MSKPPREIRLLSNPADVGPATVVVYPNRYNIGMSSLGLQQAYRCFHESGIAVQRGFFDENESDPRSYEGNEPIFRFPLVAYSLTYELDVFNLVRHLDRSGIAPLWRERDDRSPFVLVGGLAASANPAIVEEFADIICVGEGESVIPAISRVLHKQEGSRSHVLEKLAEVPGLYVPPLGFAENRVDLPYVKVEDLSEWPSHSVILTDKDEFGGAFLVEVSRGCSHRCKFCLVSHRIGRTRFRSGNEICEQVDNYRPHVQKVGLMGAAVADHPELTEIADHLVSNGLSFSTSSLRADRLSDEFLTLLRDGGNRTITLAPESGSDTQRKHLGKPIRSSALHDAVFRAARTGFANLKLYWLIGTPDTDIREETDSIIRASQELGQIFHAEGGRQVICSVTPFVPKSYTPFADRRMASATDLKRAMRHIRRVLVFRGKFKSPPASIWEAQIEAALSLEDRVTLAPKILEVACADRNLREVFETGRGG